MNKITKVGLLSLLVVVQVSTLVGGFIAYRQMSKTMLSMLGAYKELYEETHNLHVDFGLTPNPFAPLFPLVLLGLFLTVVLLIDQIRHKDAENRDMRARTDMRLNG